MKLTINQTKRMEIANDVIQQINLGKLNVARGTYCTTYDKDAIKDLARSAKDPSKLAAKAGKYCSNCAIGALFITTVAKDGKFDFNKKSIFYTLKDPSGEGAEITFSVDRDNMTTRLEMNKLFTEKQLNMIEEAFEVGFKEVNPPDEDEKKRKYKGWGTDVTPIETAYNKAFGSLFPTSKSRLTAICQNIILNYGEFKPAMMFEGR